MDVDAILSAAPRLRIMVVGDFFLDRYLWIDSSLAETSLETGLRAHQVARVTTSPGGAGNVVANLRALGVGQVDMLGVIGDDGDGYELRRHLGQEGLLATDRLTPCYLKPMLGTDGNGDTTDAENSKPGQGLHGNRPHTEGERLDIRTRAPLDRPLEDRVLADLQRALDQPPDGCLVVDQLAEHGLITPRILAVLHLLAARCRMLVDSRTRIAAYEKAHLKPNRAEAAAALGPDEPTQHARLLAVRSGRDAFVTLGADGIAACAPGALPLIVPAIHVANPDPVGAGDTAAAALFTALCSGADAPTAAHFAVRCCAVTVAKRGTTGTASPHELR